MISGVVFLGQRRNLSITLFLNVQQHYKCGLYLESLPLPESSHLPQFSPAWTIFFGDSQKRLIQSIFHGLCGIHRRIEMIKFIIIGMKILKKFCAEQKLKEHFGLKRNFWYKRIMGFLRQTLAGRHWGLP